MSLLWRNKLLRIGLAPDRIYMSGARAIELAANDGSWNAPLAALASALGGMKGEAAVVLADQFVRYTLLPYSETLKTREQWLALATHRFNTLHGPRAADWQITVTETAPMGARLACAVDRALVAELMEVFGKANMVGNGSCWIVVEEPGRLTLALIQRGMWIAIRSRRADSGWRNLLPEILERESAFLGLAQPVTRVIVCAQHDFDTEMHDAWRAEAISYRELALAAE